jgi:hypothetical protein
MWVYRQAESNAQAYGGAQLVKSTDHGVTWTPAPPSQAQQYASPMFPSPAFSAPDFVQYPNQNYSGQTADSSNTYIYAMSGNWVGATQAEITTAVLGRVLISAIGNQLASDWTFYQSGGTWGALATAATVLNTTALLSGMTLYHPAPIYVPLFGTYLAWGEITSGGVNMGDSVALEAPHPWGPWTVQSVLAPPQPTNFFFPVAKSVSDGPGYTLTILPTSSSPTYTLWGVPVTLHR